jgi:hypothetical protein
VPRPLLSQLFTGTSSRRRPGYPICFGNQQLEKYLLQDAFIQFILFWYFLKEEEDFLKKHDK